MWCYSYLIEVVVIAVVGAGSDRVSRIPTGIAQLTIVSVVGNDLLLGHFEASWIAHTTCEFKHTLSIFASERRLTIVSGYWWPHLSEDTHVLSLLHAVHS
jgi:hypothetical protein